MSDSLRQDATDKAASNLKPDSQKSTLEQAQDTVKSAGDSVASTLQPEGDKSAFQKASDSVSGTGQDSQGMMGQAQETLGNAAQSVKETLGMGEQQK